MRHRPVGDHPDIRDRAPALHRERGGIARFADPGIAALHEAPALRRARREDPHRHRARLDPAARAASLDGQALNLSPKAWRLLATLAAQPGRVYARRELEIAIWGEAQASSDNLRSVLLGLRKTLAAHPAWQVENVHGLGYKLALA